MGRSGIMNKVVYDLLLKLEECDDFHNRCDYLLEHDEITYLLEYIKMIENEKNQNIKYKQVIDKIKKYIEKENEYLEKAKEMYVECENEDIKIHTIQLINNSIVANYELNKILEEIE